MFHKCFKNLNQKMGLDTCCPARGGFFSVPWMSGTGQWLRKMGRKVCSLGFLVVSALAEKPFREKLLSVKGELRFRVT